MADHTLDIKLLGPPAVLADGAPLTVDRRKALALLAYLAAEPGEHPREALAALLAPDDEPAAAKAGLRRALAALGPALRPWLLAGGARLGLRRDPALRVDIERFRAHLAAGDPRAAVELYRGDFLSGFSLPGSAPFEEWQFFQAERLRGELADALELLTRPEAAHADVGAAAAYARRWLALDPLYEPAHRRLMQIYAAAGQQAAALRQYRVLSETLERELGALPDAASQALYEQIRRGERGAQGSRWGIAAPRLPAPAPPAAPSGAPALPFLGRAEELAQIAAALDDPGCRLLTLIGPGGMGKTRLATEAAQRNQARFPDGVVHVSLVGVGSPERVLTAIGAALGVAGQGDPLERVAATLAGRQALLVLDNAEQAVEAAPLLRALLDRTRMVKILVTSRERLQLHEEWLIDLGGLAVPDAGGVAPRDFSAVQLFAQRARQVRADFVLEGDDLTAVVAICRLVEGMPLAIELAAAWVRALTPAEIARDLAQSMALLTTTLRDVPERHRSVEGVFMQAWERLSEPERDALRRLSVFEDGFTRLAATEVAGATPAVLAALTDKALIRRERGGRYATHELLRQLAARNLAADPAAQRATRLRFCRFAMDLLARRSEDLNGRHQVQALADLDTEYDNLWNAWEWAIGAGLLDALASGLDGFYALHAMRGWYTDGIQVLERLLDGLGAAPDAEEPAVLRARAEARLGMLCSWVGQFDAAERHLAAALPALRDRGLAHDAAFALLGLGVVASERDEQQALRLLKESLEIYQRLGDQPGVAWALDALGDIAGSLGDYARARELFSESSTIYTALGDQLSAAWSLCNLGRVIGLMGDPAAAGQLLEEALGIFDALGDRHGVAAAHNNLAEIAHGAPDPAGARAHWLAALRIAAELGAAPLVIDVLVGAAGLLASAGDAQAAHELAALALDHPASWKETLSIARGLAESSAAALGPLAAAAARRGQATPWEEAAARLLRLWGEGAQS